MRYTKTMREIEREIVGGFLISADGKILLGHNVKGGAFEDAWVIPGGGTEEDETKEETLRREILEEVGIDVADAAILQLDGVPEASSEKTLRDNGERVIVHMKFNDFVVRFDRPASDIAIHCDDDFQNAKWFTPEDLPMLELGEAMRLRLEQLGLI